VVVEPDYGYHSMYQLITSAHRTLDMTVYDLASDTTVLADLVADAARGVTVRVILDGGTSGSLINDGFPLSANAYAWGYLNEHHVHAVERFTTGANTRQTTITVDDSISAIMTGILDDWWYPISRDFTIMDTDKTDGDAVEAVFGDDYVDEAVTPSDTDHLAWSQTGSEPQLLALINGAEHTLNVEKERMDDAAVASALIRAAKRGVDVKVTMSQDGRKLAAVSELADGGAHLKRYGEDESVLFIHATVIVADGSRMFIGSDTSDTLPTNYRELGFMTTDGGMISTVSSALASDYAGTTRLNTQRS
jgi:cardiolipin synthase